MGSPLGPVIAGISMSHLEMNLVTTMSDYMEPCTRYVDDIITAIDPGKVQTTLAKLNNFHHAVRSSCNSELNASIDFLEVRLTCYNINVDTAVYRKPTNSDIYIHWQNVHWLSCAKKFENRTFKSNPVQSL